MTNPGHRAGEILSGAARVAVLTGAGMSAESGVPTFRDALTGLWASFDPQSLATESAFRRDPGRVFAWYLSRLNGVRRAEPHAGYHAVVRLEEVFDKVSVVTQNVDGLHARVGSGRVTELHGSLWRFRCVDHRHPFPIEQVLALGTEDRDHVPPPSCPRCGGLVRPGVVWFGESLPEGAVAEAWQAVERADVLVVVGTSSVVYPAAELPAFGQAKGAAVIEINPKPTAFSHRADLYWPATAGAALPELVDRLQASEPAA